MLCPTCGDKIQFIGGTFICKTCNSEFDLLDTYECTIPQPIFVVVELNSQNAIIDTRKQKVFIKVDTVKKARLITKLLNKHFAEAVIKKQLSRFFNH